MRGGNSGDPDVLVEVRPEQAGWSTLNFQARRLAAGAAWSWQTGPNELALVMLGGCLDIESDRGSWSGIGARATVFDGLPSALYLPRGSSFTVRAVAASEFAVAWVQARKTGLRPAPCLSPGHLHRNPRRRQRHPPDQQHPPARLPLRAAGCRRGLHAGRQLVELPAAQARPA